jgi:23S rRNA pseudouridine1911/1915/1917 synthase
MSKEPLTVLAETKYWLALLKPAGISVERQLGAMDTLEDLAFQYLSQQSRHPFVGIVHRLDRPTSGIVLIAKKKNSLLRLNAQFSEGSIQKTYLALTRYAPASPEGILHHWLEKNLLEKKTIAHKHPVQSAQEAVLAYRVLQRQPDSCLWEIHPRTGRFHQIRAQLAAVGCPIVGDILYGGEPCEPNAIALHAWKIIFQDPDTGAPVHLQATPPHNDTWKAVLLPPD